MNRRLFSRVVCLSPWLGAAGIHNVSAQGVGGQHSLTYIPGDLMEDNERVVGYDIRMVSAIFTALPNIGPGWSLSVDNSADWRSSLRASAQLAAASIEKLGMKQGAVIFRFNQIELAGLEFDLSCNLSVTRDFMKVRTIELTRKDFRLSSD